MFYDIDAVFNESAQDALDEGKKLYYANEHNSFRLINGDGKPCYVFDGRHNVAITFDEQGGLYDYACDCNQFDSALGPCAHIVAAALKLGESPAFTDNGYRPVRHSDAAVMTVIKEYTRRKNSRFIGSLDKVVVEPVLCICAEGKVSLRLRVGRTRRYAVKDIGDFLLAIISAGTRRYGAGLKFQHSPENFDDGCRPLVDFLIKCRRDRISLGETASVKQEEMILSLGEIDEIAEIYFGTAVDVSVAGRARQPRKITDADGKQPRISILSKKDGYSISAGDGGFLFIEGRNYCYRVTDSNILRYDSSLWTKAAPLLSALSKNADLFVSKHDIAIFYNNVLTRNGGTIEIDSGDADLSVFEAPPLSASLYVVPFGTGIAATLKCVYGDTETDIISDVASGNAYRDWETESKLKSALKRYFPLFPQLNLDADSDIYLFFREGMERLYNYCDIFVSEKLSSVKIRKAPRITAGVKLHAGLLELDFSGTDFSEQELNDISAAYKNGGKFVRLTDGSFIDISDETFGAFSGLLLMGERKGKILTMPAYYAPFVEEKIREGYIGTESEFEFRRVITEFNDYDKREIDFGSADTVLRNYQKSGVKWLEMLKDNGMGGILADDMGLGKTLQTLIFISRHNKGTSIVICPTSLIINWVKEAEKFTPSLKTVAVMGGRKEREQIIENLDEFGLIVTSYELFKRDELLYSDFNFEIAVLDEAQYIKNFETKSAKTVKRLDAKYRVALTGTPIENSLSELWSIFDFLMPGYLFGYGEFRSLYEADILRGAVGAARDLRRAVRPFILRRMKSAVLKELPQKVETELIIPLSEQQKTVYEKHLALIRKSMASGETKDKITLLSMLMRLRQLCCDPTLVDPNYVGNSDKLESCLGLLKNAALSGHKVLLFSQFTSMMKIIARALDGESIKYYTLDGSTPKMERNRLTEKFNSDDTPVFLISLRAGGTGLNLTGADTVIHYDPWWNDSVMNQATDRAHRIGQTKSVQVYKLVMQNTIEEKIVKLQQKKSALASILSDIEGAELSLDEIINIIL